MTHRSSTALAIECEDPRLADLVDAITEKLQAGASIDLATYAAEYPEYAERLENWVAALRAIVDLGESFSTAGSRARGSNTGSPDEHPIAGILGDFRIKREIGRGGMGVVYEAEQISLRRRVALKVLPFAAVLDPRQLMRFKHEAQAAAMLKHPNIVSVHAVGCDRGVHYYAMELVDGWGLDRVGKEQEIASEESGDRVERSGISVSDTAPIAALATHVTDNPRERFRQIARLGIQAAEALQYAHEMGIVHRDIKPSNLLVDVHGHLWITDFGLATTQADAGLTMTGDLLGTLRYMSPEQAAGDRPRIDYRTDIYSLGITLYELLAGQPAFADTDRKILFRRIIEDEPKPLRSIDAAIPGDLETIVLKAIEKEPHARYDSATELAADLARFCDDKPIRARRTSRAERIWRWGKRNRLVAALTITVATLVSLVAITAPMIAWRQAQLVDETRQQLYGKDMSIAYNAWNDGDLGHARELLDRYAAGSRYAHLRDFPWYYLDGLLQRETSGFLPGLKFDISPNTNLVAVDAIDQYVHLYDAQSWTEVATLSKNRPDWMEELRFSPDGRFLAATYRDGTLSAWDVPARKYLYTITLGSLTRRHYTLGFSPDGLLLATGGPDHLVKIWERTSGELLHDPIEHGDDVTALVFSPDGKTLATATMDLSLRLYDTGTWQPRTVIENAFGGRAFALAYDPTGTRLAAGGWGRGINMWDASGQPSTTLASSGDFLCFSPDGRLLAVGSEPRGTAQVWNVDDQQLIQQFHVGQGLHSVGFLPDGDLLFSSDDKLKRRQIGDATDAETDQSVHKAHRMSEKITFGFSAAGDFLVAGFGRYFADPGEGAIVCRDLRRGKQWLLPGHDGSSVMDVAIDAAGELIVAAGGPGNGPGFVKVWNARTGMLAAELPAQKFSVTGISISPSGDGLAVVGSGEVAVWANLAGQPELVWKRAVIRPVHVAFSPRGDVVAVACFEGDDDAMVLDAVTGEQLQVLRRRVVSGAMPSEQLEVASNQGVTDLAFSPDGELLALIRFGGQVDVYDWHQQRTILSDLAHQGIGLAVAFSPDGRTLASASTNGDIKFWNLQTMMHVTTLKTRGRVGELAFFPDGRTLAVGYLDRTVELWHVDQEKEQFSIDSAEP